MKNVRTRLIQAMLVLAIIILVALALRPRPAYVDVGQVKTGTLREIVEDEGETRAHDRYAVAAPIAGQLMRIELHDGDQVVAGQVVAVMRPSPLDAREKSAAAARVTAAEELKRAAEEQIAHDRAELEQARRDRMRAEQMGKHGIVSAQAMEQSRTAEQIWAKQLKGSEFKARAARAQVREARAALLASDPEQGGGERFIRLRAPLGGPVLRVLEKSERVVAAGTQLLLIGDPKHLEVVVDLLSSDAVKVRPGADVFLEEWGGEHPLKARVRTIEPYAFTKVSALGIEEQRVNIVIDFVDPPGSLGDGYRVNARIITWASDRVVKIPASSLFRNGDNWCVYSVEQGNVKRRLVQVGHRNPMEVEVLSGLRVGETVVLHPSNQLDDGMRVRTR